MRFGLASDPKHHYLQLSYSMKLYFVALNGPISDPGRGNIQPTICICMTNNMRLGVQKHSTPFSFEFNTLTT